MSRRFAVAGMLALALTFPSVAAAQETPVSLGTASFAMTPTPSFVTSLGVAIPLADLEQIGRPQLPPAPERVTPGKSRLMSSLYASTVAMQALDVHSTLKALGNGGIEANPMMSGLTRNKAAFIAVKAAVESSLDERGKPCLALAERQFDGHKGVALTFDARSGVLQQPLYSVTTR